MFERGTRYHFFNHLHLLSGIITKFLLLNGGVMQFVIMYPAQVAASLSLFFSGSSDVHLIYAGIRFMYFIVFLSSAAVAPEGKQSCVTLVQSAVSHTGGEVPHMFARSTLMSGAGLMLPDTGLNPIVAAPAKSSPKKSHYLPIEPDPIEETEVHPVMMWQSSSLLPPPDTQKLDSKALEPKELNQVLSGKIMPPPPLLPIRTRRASSNLRLIVPDTDPTSLMPEKMKTELAEETNSQSPEDVKGIDLRLKPVATSNPLATVADLSSTQSPTMATFRQFVTGSTNVPLPNQSAQSVEKYLSNLEHATDTALAPKSISDRIASACKIASSVAPTASQICLNTHPGSPHFDSASALFRQQQSNTAAGAVDPKLQYASDLSVPLLYSAKTAAKMAGQECKLQVPAKETSLLQQATAARRKSMFNDTLAITPSAETLLGGRRPIVIIPESQNVENGISSVHSTPAESIDQNIPVMSTVSKASALLQQRSELIYSSPQRRAMSSLLPASVQSTETGMLDRLSKGNNTVGIVGRVHDSPLLSPPSPLLGDQMLAVTQPSIIVSTQNARLDALISSAMNNHVLGPDNHIQSSNTDKLDALVNSAAASHMIPAPVTAADNIMLNNPLQAPLRQQSASSTDQMSPISVKKMTDTGLGSFDILPAQNSNTEISQSTQLLNSAMSAALNEHLLVTPTKAQVQTGTQLSTVPSSPENALYTNHDQASPTVTKSHILNSSIATTAEGQILVASPTHTTPVTVKSMVLESPNTLPHNDILASSSSPNAPLAVKQMVAAVSPEGQVLIASPTSAPMENIMNSAIAQQGNGQMILTGPTCTSPVAMKTMIFESAASDQCLVNPVHTSPIAVKTMILKSQLSGSVDEGLVPRTTAQSAHMSTESARLDALVQSTLNEHAFVSNEPQMTSALDVQTGNGMTILTHQAHVQQSSQVPSTSPLISHPSACITTLITQSPEPPSHLPVPAVTTDDALMNTIFTTSRGTSGTDSSLQAHSFNKEGTVMVGEDSQTPCCTSGSALLHASQFTTASSNSGSLVTGITMPSKMAEQLAAQSRDSSSGFVTQMLLGLAADEKIKKDSDIALMSRDKITESLQQQGDFSKSKLPETRLFAAPQMLKAAVGDLLKSAVEDVPSLHSQSRVTTVSDLLITKQQSQEVQEQECKQHQLSVTPQTTTCVTVSTATTPGQPQKKAEEGMVPQELTQMSENDLLSYINPSAFDQV
ncbi:hypothetical protein B7P43_G15588 [Cryptotermes secundus]|uniref:Uncharacterized protein n=1 Tax=Cryptotermes secundus TaxID=105785 RepID=A0A2J7PRH2_9NEOP|nr:hypothetical protein B7P43_G15588 [Cryptotermes secundus]